MNDLKPGPIPKAAFINIKIIVACALCAISFLAVMAMDTAAAGGNAKAFPKKPIAQVDNNYPKIPQPFKMRDWTQVALDFEKLVFDVEAAGQYLPIAQWDYTGVNGVAKTLFLPAYVGDTRVPVGGQEGLTVIGAILGSSLAGLDMTGHNGENYVEMTKVFYNRTYKLLCDNKNGTIGGSFWYDIFPAILFSQLAGLYPEEEYMEEIMLLTADYWRQAAYKFGPAPDELDFAPWTGYSSALRQPSYNGVWCEMDGGVAIGLLCYYAYQLSGERRFLEAALDCMYFYENFEKNPMYETLGLWAALLAARMNAETGTTYHTEKYMKWYFEADSDDRGGHMGSANFKFGDYDAHGIYTSYNGGGYAFTMDTFVAASATIPVAKYDARYARSIGRFALNVANNARLFYPGEWEDSQRTSTWWKGDPYDCIPYEALRAVNKGVSPWAGGDPLEQGWAETDFGIYSGHLTGYMAAMFHSTEDDVIIQVDLNGCDFHAKADFPCYLYYNPYDSAAEIILPLDGTYDIYETVSNAYLYKNASGEARLRIPADDAIIVKLLPAGSDLIQLKDGRIFCGEKYIGAIKPAVNITNILHKQLLSGIIEVGIDVALTDGDSVRKLTVMSGDSVLYSTEGAIWSYTLDTAKLPDGFQTLTVAIETDNGYADDCELRVLVYNNEKNVVVDYGPDEMAGLPAVHSGARKLNEAGDAMVLVSNDSTGFKTQPFLLDFDREPVFYLEAPYMQHGLLNHIKLADKTHSEYVSIPGGTQVHWSSDLKNDLIKHHRDRTGITGVQPTEMYVMSFGWGTQSTSEISRLLVFYQDEEAVKPREKRGANSLNYAYPDTGGPDETIVDGPSPDAPPPDTGTPGADEGPPPKLAWQVALGIGAGAGALTAAGAIAAMRIKNKCKG